MQGRKSSSVNVDWWPFIGRIRLELAGNDGNSASKKPRIYGQKPRYYAEFGLSGEFEHPTIGRGFKSLRAHHVTWVWSAFLLECGWARFCFRPHFTHTLASFGSVLGRNTALEARSNPVFVWVLVNRAELTN